MFVGDRDGQGMKILLQNSNSMMGTGLHNGQRLFVFKFFETETSKRGMKMGEGRFQNLPLLMHTFAKFNGTRNLMT